MIRVLYIISILLLLLALLCLKKYDKRVSIVREIVYAVCLFLCYNTVMVFFISYCGLKGSLLLYSFINILIGIILFLITLKNREIQKYKFDKKEALLVICFACFLGLVSYFKSGGETEIHYLVNSDPAIHYRSALSFSENLVLLNKKNSSDIVFGSFDRLMPMSYVNGGFFIKVFEEMKSYKAFMLYDGLCYVLCSLLFFVTLLEMFNKNNRKTYLYLLVIGLLYSLAFPLNSFLFGFCYLGLGVMVVNLLLLTVFKFKNHFKDGLWYKLMIIFIIVFSVFLSYYLFVPSIYLSLGIYYIVLYRTKKIELRDMFLYGGITLILPFVIGFCHFLVPFFMEGNTVSEVIELTGACYDNVTPIILFLVFTIYLIVKLYNNELECNYLNLAVGIHTIYIMIFLMLYCFKVSELYYLYKLFFVYWIYVVIYVAKIFWDNKKWLFMIGVFIFSLAIVSKMLISSKYVSFLSEIDIYNFNILNYDFEPTINRDELRILDESIKYKDMCEYNNTFPMIGSWHKNYWYYAVTGSVPVIFDKEENIGSAMLSNELDLFLFDYLPEYKCVVYYRKDSYVSFDEDKYDVLYENNGGAILKKTDEWQAKVEQFFGNENA